MALWRKRLFAALHRNASSTADFFHLPPDQVFEVGSQIVI
jgi:KUP system potassium uptake protein